MTLITPRQSPRSDDSFGRRLWTGPPDDPHRHEQPWDVVGSAHAVPSSRTDLAALNARFEGAPPEDIFAWVFSEFWPAVSVVSSFQNCVLVDLAVRTDPRAEIVFLDTGSHFPETISFVEQVRRLYGLEFEDHRARCRRRVVALWFRTLLRAAQGRSVGRRAKRTCGVVERPEAERYPDSGLVADRRVGYGEGNGQGQPAGLLERRGHLPLRSRPSASGPPLEGARLPVDRL